jgi:hypothetical protein
MSSKIDRIAAIVAEPSERVGCPASEHDHATLRLEAARITGPYNDPRPLARFLIEGV